MKYSPPVVQILENQKQQNFCFSTAESQDLILAWLGSETYCDMRESIH